MKRKGQMKGGRTWDEWAKQNSVVSTLLGTASAVSGFIPGVNLLVAPALAAASGAAKLGGYGKKKMRGKGDAEYIARAVVGKPAMRGGDARLSIVPENMRLQGKGITRQYNGLLVQTGGRRIRGRGAGTEYGTVSSAFGEISA